MAEEAARRGSFVGARRAIGIMVRSTGVGVGGGSFASVVAMAMDPHGPSAKAAGMIGALLGGLSGFYEIRTKNRRDNLAIDLQSNLAAKLEAERKLAVCEAENLLLKAQVREHAERIKGLEVRVSMDHAEIDKLTDRVVQLAELLARLDKGARTA